VFENPASFVYFLRCPSLKLIEALRKHGRIDLIYSQWEGYLKEAHKTYCTDIINGLKKDKDIGFHAIHTSGHATMRELKEFAKAINPKQIVPIHTENPNKFKQELEKEGFQNVALWEDNHAYQF
jgi:ribonuclease J